MQPAPSDFDLIKTHIALLELDDRDLQPEQFLAACEDNKLLGFGRIRKHKTCDEFLHIGCNNSHAKQRHWQKNYCRNYQGLHLTLIPGMYYSRLFHAIRLKIVSSFPVEMQDKLDYCNRSLAVEETYVVMKLIC